MGCCTSINETKPGGPRTQGTYSAAVENRGDSTYVASTRHGPFVMSTSGRGPNPVDTLLASLCGCVGHYVHDYLDAGRIAADGFTVRAGATSTPDGARLADIDIVIEVKGIALEDRQRAELRAAAEHCKIHNTLKSACGIRLNVIEV